jgi:hypothetical protein
MHSIMGGEYPGPGAQIGVAMSFGYIAAMHAAQSETARHESDRESAQASAADQ